MKAGRIRIETFFDVTAEGTKTTMSKLDIYIVVVDAWAKIKIFEGKFNFKVK